MVSLRQKTLYFLLFPWLVSIWLSYSLSPGIQKSMSFSSIILALSFTLDPYETRWVVNTSIVFSYQRILAMPTPFRTKISPSNFQKFPLCVNGTNLTCNNKRGQKFRLYIFLFTSMMGCLDRTASPEQPKGRMKLEQPELILSYGVANGIALEIIAQSSLYQSSQLTNPYHIRILCYGSVG